MTTVVGTLTPQHALAYSSTMERPVFLAWPLPSYIGVARISQFPNTPWTWNYLGLNPGQQCPPAFGYVANVEFWSVWKDNSIPADRDMAKADPHNFEMVNCYSTLGEAGKNGHEATDIKAPAGTPSLASADGKVAGWRLDNLNSMIVLKHCLGGQWDADGNCAGGKKWYTTYMHVSPENDLLEMNKDVSVGDSLGIINNQGDNSHLHFEVGLEQRSYFNYVNPWGRDEAPWGGCMWLDQSLCIQPNPGYKRMGFVTESDRFFVMDDHPFMTEVHGMNGVQQFQLAGHRVAIVNEIGELLVKDLEVERNFPFSHDHVLNWVDLGNNVAAYQFTNTRLVILEATGQLKVKEEDLNSDWALQVDEVQSFSISPHRIGVINSNGELLVQEGSLKNDWVKIAANVKVFQLIDSRIAVVDMQGNLFVQEGAITNEWKSLAANIQAFQLSGTRVAFMDENGLLMVNDGNLRAPWIMQADLVRSFQLADNRIVILDQEGKYKIKDGDLYEPWKEFTSFSVKDIKLNGDSPVWITQAE
ncbi:MAG: M23 family metallopeptidase [Anaerolineales bacterium]